MPNRRDRPGACAILCLALGLCLPATQRAVAETATRERSWFATIHASQWISSNLADVPRRFGTGDIEMQSAYFVSGQLGHVLVPVLRTDLPLIGRVIDGGSIEIEGQLGWQFGQQRHGEATIALLWRSRELALPLGEGSVNFAIGEGLSQAFSRPTLEGRATGREPRKFLNYLAFEAEFSHPAMPGLTLVPRLHHRSGIFGLIAPQGTGSNFVGLGLRATLR